MISPKPLPGNGCPPVRTELPTTSIYMEADYSNQMNRDLAAGDLDLAILYTPHYLPDLHYERIGDMTYTLVATTVKTVAELQPETYIQAVYSPAFDRAHRLALPQLSSAPLASGQNIAITGLLKTLAGAAYVTRATAMKLADEGTAFPIEDAPLIQQAVYAATSIRTRHAHQHRRIIAVMQDLLGKAGIRTGNAVSAGRQGLAGHLPSAGPACRRPGPDRRWHSPAGYRSQAASTAWRAPVSPPLRQSLRYSAPWQYR